MRDFPLPHARETFEVLTLANLGMSQRQARGFTQWLDDERPCGVSASELCYRIKQYIDVECMRLATRCEKLEEDMEILRGPLGVAMIAGR